MLLYFYCLEFCTYLINGYFHLMLFFFFILKIPKYLHTFHYLPTTLSENFTEKRLKSRELRSILRIYIDCGLYHFVCFCSVFWFLNIYAMQFCGLWFVYGFSRDHTHTNVWTVFFCDRRVTVCIGARRERIQIWGCQMVK